MGYRKTGLSGFIFAAAVATVLFVMNSATPLPMRADSQPSPTMVADATLVALAAWEADRRYTPAALRLPS